MSIATTLTVLGIIAAFLLSAAGLVGTWAALKTGRNAQTLKNYKDLAESYQAKSESQEGEIRDLKGENRELLSQVSELQGKMSVLQELVRSAVESLASGTSGNQEILDRLDKLTRSIQGNKL